MDKLYSKSALIIKIVFCALLSQLYLLISSLLSVEDNFLFILLVTVPIFCLYTVPFWVSLIYIKRFRVNKILKYITLDALCCLLPAFLSVVISEVIYTVAYNSTIGAGVITIIFTTVYVIISLIFWLFYYIFSYKTKNRP